MRSPIKRNRAGRKTPLCTALVTVCLLSLVVVGVYAAESAAKDSGLCLMWRISSDGATVHLFGSLHFGDQGMYPLDDAITEAFEEADALVVEIDVTAKGRGSPSALAMTEGMYHDCGSLREALSKEAFAELEARMEEKGVSLALFKRMKPWCMAFTLQTMEIVAAGYSPALGIDRHFLNSARTAGKEILELETAEDQIKLFSEMPPELQEAMLLDVVRGEDGVADLFAATIDAWRKGDAATLNDLVVSEMKDDPKLRERVFDDRNVAMADKILEYLKTDKTYFVVVGAGHLTGGKGIVPLLREKGFELAQVKRKNPLGDYAPPASPLVGGCGGGGAERIDDIVIPTGEDAYTWRSLNRDEYTWWRDVFRKTYARRGSRNEKWDAVVERFHDQYAKYVSGNYQDWNALREALLTAADELIELNCDDPYLTYCVGNVFHSLKNAKIAVPYVRKGLRELEKSDYPALFKFYAARRMRDIAIALNMGGALKSKLWRKHLIHLAESVGDEMAKQYPRLWGMEVKSVWKCLSFENKEFFYRRVKRVKHPVPWLEKMIDGEFHVTKGWKARGTGWASSVTEEGWKVFREELAAARKAFVEAWRLRPEFPEVAARMLSVRMASAGPVSEEEWFNRAVQAQMDYKPAYHYYIWAIRPRWGGSHEAMLAFGRKCLDTERFDTHVPYIYVKTLNDVLSETSFQKWKMVLNRPGVHDRLMTLYDELIASDAWPCDERLKLERTAYNIWAGRFEGAQSTVLTTPNKIYDKAFHGSCGDRLPCFREYLVKEIGAFTGDFAEILKQAESLFREDDPDAAMALLKQTLPMIEREETREHVLEWIARAMINDDLKSTFRNRRSPLHIAVDAGRIDVVDFLLENDYDPNLRDGKGRTPLFTTTCLGEEDRGRASEIAKSLLEHGANPDLATEKLIAPLHQAVYIDDANLVDLLLQNGTDVDVRDDGDDTPLHWAVWNHKNSIAEHLIDKGADPDIPNKTGKTPLVYAILKKNPDAFNRLLEEKVNLETVTAHGWRPVHLAAHYSGAESVAALIDHGADPHAPTKKMRANFAHLAAQKGDLETLKLAAEKGVALDVQTSIGETPLHLAMIRGKPDVVRFLLEQGARIDLKKRNGQTPLHIACHRGRPEAVKILLEAGADVSIKDTKGNTPLDLATKRLSKTSGKKKNKFEEIIKRLSAAATNE